MGEYIEREAAKNAIYAAMRKHDEYDSCERKIIGGRRKTEYLHARFRTFVRFIRKRKQ